MLDTITSNLHILGQILFDQESDTTSATSKLAEKEELSLCEQSAVFRCQHAFCPSSICVRSIQMENGDAKYYIAFIPHFHSSPLYDADLNALPSFLKLVIAYHAGCEYFHQQQKHSPSIPIALRMVEECRLQFVDDMVTRLREAAMTDFGQSSDVMTSLFGEKSGMFGLMGKLIL